MPSRLAIPVVAALALCLHTRGGAERVESVYRTHCAVCHGSDLRGGLGSSLVDGEWEWGATDDDIYQSIAQGNEAMGMQGFGDDLSREQIHALVVYIREMEHRAQRRTASPPRPAPEEVTQTRHHAYRTDVLVEGGLDIPWAIAFLPDGRMLVTERPGPLRVLSADGTLHPDPVAGTPEVVHHGQGGMMEVALHPRYEENGWIYLGFSDGLGSGGRGRGRPRCMTAVVRGRIRDHEWVDQEWIYRAGDEFYTGSGVHFGTRFVFRNGYIFFVMGERGGWDEAQDLSRPNGKIFRLHDDGRVPADNPFVDREGALPGIWSYGHRNPQGLALRPGTGGIWSTEHGPRGGDELNRIERGANYGWPVISHGMNYDGTPFTGETRRPGMESPVLDWTPSIAVCGLDFYEGAAFPKWDGDLFAGALKFQEVRRIRLRDGAVAEEEIILKGLGRVRDVAAGPDGYLYVLLNRPGRVIRLLPAE